MQCFLRQERRVIPELSSLGLHLAILLKDLLPNALSLVICWLNSHTDSHTAALLLSLTQEEERSQLPDNYEKTFPWNKDDKNLSVLLLRQT